MTHDNTPTPQASHHALGALSPLDGRYAHKMAALRETLSEFGYLRARVQVEAAWFIALSEAKLDGFAPLSAPLKRKLGRLHLQFSIEDAAAIKAIERETNHDVKAVEYWLKRWLSAQHDQDPALVRASEFVHFACTSEDINNTSHALMLQAACRDVMLPTLDRVIEFMGGMAVQQARRAMLARTHGQTASPTTLGKEIANVVARLQGARTAVAAVQPRAKMNGAVGNYNAHVVAYPNVDWPALSRRVVTQKLHLTFNPTTTQIEPHDWMAELFDALARTNTILLDWSRDVWGYVSLGYFKQRLKAGETGSSTMPHKINPIDFENAEGNLGLANALLSHLSHKLPVSRWQRDLTDSTVLRNLGVALGHTLLAWDNLLQGLGKLEVNHAALDADLDGAWEVLAEPIQTVMRRHGLANPYEALKTLTRGKAITRASLHAFIDKQPLPERERKRLKAMTPATYVGLAAQLTHEALGSRAAGKPKSTR
jgi:adenylosuccinate lyase